MNKKTQSGFDRRKFLQDGGAAIVAAGCFSTVGLRVALREALAADKPLLTEQSLNAHIQSMRRTKESFRAWTEEVKNDLKGHLGRNFHVTASQQRELDAMFTPDVIRQLNDGLDRAVKENLKVRVRIIGAPRERRAHAAMPLPSVHIHIGRDGVDITASK